MVPYRPEWPERFREWRARLAQALGEGAQRINHVGSTSVPGLAAKPVIDLGVAVARLEQAPAMVPSIERLGLQLGSRDQWHLYFRPGPDRPREVQLHLWVQDSDFEREHLLFRDYLRAHPGERDRYQRLKQKLAALWGADRLLYTDEKTGFRLDALERAEPWAAASRWRPTSD